MNNHRINWTAIGSIGTVVGALIALAPLFFMMWDSKRHWDTVDAAEIVADIRRNLLTYSQESQVLSKLLRDGSPLIRGAASITKQLKKRLGPSATADDFQRAFGDEDTMLSGAVVGWHESDLSGRLNTSRDSQQRISLRFTGYPSLFRYAGE